MSRLVMAIQVLLFVVSMQISSVQGGHYVPADKKLKPQWVKSLFDKGSRRVYRGAELETIGMPCGGIGAGQLYVRGDGTLAQWWITNDFIFSGYGRSGTCRGPLGDYPSGYRPEPYRPISRLEQGFAIRVIPEGEEPQSRKLSRDGFDDIGFIGEYPIATILYGAKEKPALPVEVQAEVFSPWIPLDARNSANPGTVLHYTISNTSGKSLDVAISGWLQKMGDMTLACLDRRAKSVPRRAMDNVWFKDFVSAEMGETNTEDLVKCNY